jgi:hypothetical protein
MIEALIYGDNHIKIIENFSSQPHINALKNDNQVSLLLSISALRASGLTQ